MRQRRSRLKGALALVLGGVVAVAVLEAALRTIEVTPLWRVLPLIEPILGQADADTGYAFVPGAQGIWQRENRAPVHINALGLRNPEMPHEKPPGTLRIGLTGDSMVEALQVEQAETFAARAEARLNAAGRPVQVLNLAMSGNGPLRQLVRLEKLAPGLDLDMAVSLLAATDFLTGELRDDSQNPGYVADGQGGLRRGDAFRQRFAQRAADTWAGRGLMAVIRHSAVARMLYLRSREPLPSLLGVKATTPAVPAAAAAPDCGGSLDRLLRLWRDHEPAADWQAAQTLLDEFAAHARNRGIGHLLLIDHIPLAASGCPADADHRGQLVGLIRQDVERRGMVFVDWRRRLLDVAPAADLNQLQGFGLQRGHGGHLNPLGHRVYAEALAATLTPFVVPAEPAMDNRAGMQ